jgi:hypothetical protein
VCSVYDVNEKEKDEENKKKKRFVALTVASLLKGKQKNSLFRML